MKKFLLLNLMLLFLSWGIKAQIATQPVIGDGTSGNPYQIATLENLYWIAAADAVVATPSQAVRLAAHYIQTEDIYASSTHGWSAGWTPIGNTYDSYFSGNYDGQEHIISELYIADNLSYDAFGFFGVAIGATIQNLGIVNVDINGTNGPVGSLVGYAVGVTINHCHSLGNVTANNSDYANGGLVGILSENSIMLNCYSACNVSGAITVGGLVGQNYDSEISNSYYSAGTLTGRAMQNSSIGGLVGTNNGSISECYSNGTVYGYDYTGGLIGLNFTGAIIANCYSRCNSSNNSPYGAHGGGLVGTNYSGVTITNCYSSGTVTSIMGGLVGIDNEATVNSFWDNEAAGTNWSTGGTGKTSLEMKTQSTFTGWDFNAIWTLDEGYNDGYPFLLQVPCFELANETIELNSGSNTQTVCANTAITSIEYYVSTGDMHTVGASISPALPPGLEVYWYGEENLYSISGTPTVAGTYTYTVTTIGSDFPCNEATATGTITVKALPVPPTGSGNQSFSAGNNPTVADLAASGTNIIWYDAATDGNLLLSSEALTDGNHYYASQTVEGCESTARLDVLVSLSAISETVFNTSGTFIVPAGVTQIKVQLWGGGGRGGGGFNNPFGGGGGGAYSESNLNVTSLTSYTVQVGLGQNMSGYSPGEDSWFGTPTTVMAKGGISCNNTASGGNGGYAASGYGDIKYSGGKGANSLWDINGFYSGGGGSSAGTDANGAVATNAQGAVAPTGGGNGGNGIDNTNVTNLSGPGSPGFVPGGGGGGALNYYTGSPSYGGSGANGLVIVSWEVGCGTPPPTANAQSFCITDAPLVGELEVSGEAGATFNWYDDPEGGSPLSEDAALTTAKYYVSQTVADCQSARTLVSVTVNQVLPVSVSITSSDADNIICAEDSVILTASPTNGGASPSYQWWKNDSAVDGQVSATYIYKPVNNDSVYIVMESNALCLSGSPATSNVIKMIVTTPPEAGIITGPISAIVTGETHQLLVTGGDPSGTWASTNTEVATVNTSGLVTGVGAGTTTIIYTVTGLNECEGVSDQAEYPITVGTYVSKIFTSSTTFTVPDGVVRIDAKAWGGGGGAAGRNIYTGYAGGGGGGGGFRGGTLAVSPGDIITITVGQGGPGGSIANPNGSLGASSIVSHSPDMITAYGGTGPYAGAGWGYGGEGVFSGTVTNKRAYRGGDGGYRTSTSTSSGGGGGSGDAGNGVTGSVPAGGAGGWARGGKGGDGSTTVSPGGDGLGYGGGGGGGSSIVNSTGGNGANGAVIISWISAGGCTPPAITLHPSTTTQPLCLDGNASAISVTATGSDLSYQWYSNTTALNTGGTIIEGATSQSYIPLTSALGTLYYYCEVSNACPPLAISNVSGAIIVNQLPDAFFATKASNTPICESEYPEFYLAGTANAVVTYHINGETSQTFTLNSSGEAIVIGASAFNNQTMYLENVLNPATGCSRLLTVNTTVEVKPLPFAFFDTPASNSPVCSGDDVYLYISATPSSIITYHIVGAEGNQQVTIDETGKKQLTISQVESNITVQLISIEYPGGLCPVALEGITTVTVKVNPIAIAPALGDGTISNPYQIATLENLYWITVNKTAWDKHFIQTADIDASATVEWCIGGWLPIGDWYVNDNTGNRVFSGSYDGKGHTISGLHMVNNSSYIAFGLFGRAINATIKNLGITNTEISGVAGDTGALVGSTDGCVIDNCYSTGTIVVSGFQVGGLVGTNGSNSTISNCHSTCNVTGTVDVGGLVGLNLNYSTITNCYYTGGTVDGSGSYMSATGGLVGVNDYYSSINKCYSTGTVNGYDYTGGLVGSNNRESSISNCFSRCMVSGHPTYSSNCGGFVGYNTDNSLITNCYSTGSVGSLMGGLVGYNDSGSVLASYWDTETSGKINSYGGIGKLTAEMKTQSTFTDWDFTSIWGINTSNNDGYPYFVPVSICTDGTITLTSASETANQMVCANTAITSITYTVGGSATGAEVSDLPDGVTGNYSNGTFTISGTPTVAGVYDYTVTTTGAIFPCTEETATGTITVILEPEVRITRNNSPICYDRDAEFYLEGTPGAEVTYSFDGGETTNTVILKNGIAVVTDMEATSNVTLSLVSIKLNSAGCSQTLNNTSTVVVKSPSAIISGPHNACVSATLTAVTDASNPIYMWGKEGQLIPDESSSALEVTESGLYQLLVYDTFTGCSEVSDVFIITFGPLPEVNITGNNSPICYDKDAEFYLEGTPDAEVTFSFDGGLTTRTVNLVGGTARVVDMEATSNVTLSLISIKTNSFGCNKALNNTSIVTVSRPTAIISGITNDCTSVTLTAVTDASNPTYMWGKDGELISNESSSTLEVTESGEYLLLVNDGITGCYRGSDAFIVTIYPLPTASIMGGWQYACESTLLTAATKATNPIFSWYKDDILNPTEEGPSMEVTQPGSYTVKVTEMLTGCATTSDAFVVSEVNQMPLDRTVTAIEPSVCLGDSSYIIITDYQSDVTYQLRNDDGDILIDSRYLVYENKLYLYTDPLYTNTTFNVVASRGACSVEMTDKPTITVLDVTEPVITSVTADPPVICVGGSTTLNVNGTLGGADLWKWYGRGECGGPIGLTGTSITVSPTQTWTFYVRAEGRCAGSVECATVTVTVVEMPVAGSIIKMPDVETICEGTEVYTTFTEGSGGVDCTDTYTYRYNGIGEWATYTPATILSTTGHSLVEIRTQRGGCQEGCNTDTRTVSWTVEATPVAGTLAKTPDVSAVCEGSEVSAMLTPGSGGNGTNEIEYRTKTGTIWSTWANYASGNSIPTDGVTSIEIQTRHMADICQPSAYNMVSWLVEARPVLGDVEKYPNVESVCEGSGVSARTYGGSGGLGTVMQYRTQTGATWSDWILYSINNNYYVPSEVIFTTGKSGVEFRARRLASTICSSSDWEYVSWSVVAQPVAGTIIKAPESETICAGTEVYATFAEGSGGVNCTDTYTYRYDGIGEWTTYTPATILSTTGHSLVEISTQRGGCQEGCANDTRNVSWTVEATPVAGTLAKTPDVSKVCEGSEVSAILIPGSGGNGKDEFVYRTNDGIGWSEFTNYTPGILIGTSGKTAIEVLTRRMGTYCTPSEYNTVSWEVESTPVAGILDKDPDMQGICEGTGVKVTLNTGSGGNGYDELEYYTVSGRISSVWTTYISGTEISTSGKSAVGFRTRRMADVCSPSSYNIAIWSVEATPVAGTLVKTPDVATLCEGSEVSATLTPGSGGNFTDELDYQTKTGTSWSGWTAYVSGTAIPTTDKSGVEIRTRRIAEICDHSAYNTVSWEVNLLPVITLSNASTSAQYSDPIVPVTITVTDDGSLLSLIASTKWKLQSDIGWTHGLPGNLSLDDGTTNDGIWALGGIANIAPGSYTIKVTINDVQCSSSIDITLIVTQENAITAYTGQEFVGEQNPLATTTALILSASVTDIDDSFRGDIRNARVQFYDVNTLATLSDWLIPGLIVPGDLTQGVVTQIWNAPVPATGYSTFTIGVKVGTQNPENNGYYTGSDKAIVNVYRTDLYEFISGGGHIIPTLSKGTYASDPGRKVNFGFNVKWNKTMRQLQGNLNLVFRIGEKVYQIKANSMSSLSINSINPCSQQAVFTSKANLTDVTLPKLPIEIKGNLILQVTMTNNTSPGAISTIGFTVYDGNTLLYSSNWPVNKTEELALVGGNLLVHNGVKCILNNAVDVMLYTSKNPTFVGEEVIFEATVTPKGSTLIPEGNIVFSDGNSEIATVEMSNGKATLAKNDFAEGLHLVTAKYMPSNDFESGMSAAVMQQVISALFTLQSNINPSMEGESVIFIATVSGPAGGDEPTGTITFREGTYELGTKTIAVGTASIEVSGLTPGTHTITAEYSGNYGVLYASIVQTISSNVSVTLTSSKNPEQVNNNVSFTANIEGSGSALAGVQVSFFINKVLLTTVTTNDNGSAVANHAFSIVGTYIVEARYNGQSATISQVIKNKVKTVYFEPVVEYADLKVYPNPFSDRLRFEFVSPEAVDARIELYDLTGRLVKIVFEQPVEGNKWYEVDYRSEAIMNAIYFYRVTLGDVIYDGKVIFMKD